MFTNRKGLLSEYRFGDKALSVLMESSSSSGSSSKRAKGFDSIRHAVSCSVDGCNSDLSQCREYHRRHKVCELHSKTPMVTIAGREQRFCQQCSRFHSLVEFDDEKRSCRKRLDGHNRRRRKPQSDPLLKSPGSFLSSQQGGTLLSFSTTPQLLSSAIPDSSWAGPIKLEADAGPYYCHDNAVGSLAHSLGGGGNQFKIISGGNYPNLGPLFTRPVLGPGNSNELGPRVVDSDCALSLLSSAMAENRGIGLSHSSVHDMQYCGNLGQFPPGGLDSKPVASYSASNLPCQGLFQSGLDWPSSSGPDSARSFKWE